MTERHRGALRSWLATEPEVLGATAYNEFAEEHNKHLPGGAVALGTSNTIRRNLSITWPTGLKVARGELTLGTAFEADLADRLPVVIDADTLVRSPAIALILRTTLQGVAELSSKGADFPTPVAHIAGNPAWLHEDIKLFRHGLKVPDRKLDERQNSILAVPELAVRLGVREKRTRRLIREKQWDRVLEPEGSIEVDTFYWRREKVEAWETERAKTEQAQAEAQATSEKEIGRKKQERKEARRRFRERVRSARASTKGPQNDRLGKGSKGAD